MKKNYIAPIMSMDELALETIIAQSGLTATSLDDMPGYGGLDKDGSKDPSAKSRNEWEDGLW